MNLQSRLERAFPAWQPSLPEVLSRNKHDVTLSWKQQDLGFLQPSDLLYRLEKKEKIPPWVVVYSGSKSTKKIDNLASCNPHKFRLRVIVKASTVPYLAERAVEHYDSEELAYEQLKNGLLKDMDEITETDANGGDGDNIKNNEDDSYKSNIDGTGDTCYELVNKPSDSKKKWLESLWSEDVCTSTDSEGTSTTCFCMAVRGGYLKQVQIMLEERPELIGIINSTNGLTPLATAVRKGDINMVRYLLSMGAEVDQRCSPHHTPLHLAVLGSHTQIADLLLEKGADFQVIDSFCVVKYWQFKDLDARDINDLRVEHCAVDSCELRMLRHILDRGGDITVTDNNGWTPLFRAICQGSSTDIIEELVSRGSQVDINDAAGLSLPSAARLLTNRHGRARESIMRLVDAQFPHEKALAAFTRLTKKISSLHTVFK